MLVFLGQPYQTRPHRVPPLQAEHSEIMPHIQGSFRGAASGLAVIPEHSPR
jgi:hypothetical protein